MNSLYVWNPHEFQKENVEWRSWSLCRVKILILMQSEALKQNMQVLLGLHFYKTICVQTFYNAWVNDLKSERWTKHLSSFHDKKMMRHIWVGIASERFTLWLLTCYWVIGKLENNICRMNYRSWLGDFEVAMLRG